MTLFPTIQPGYVGPFPLSWCSGSQACLIGFSAFSKCQLWRLLTGVSLCQPSHDRGRMHSCMACPSCPFQLGGKHTAKDLETTMCTFLHCMSYREYEGDERHRYTHRPQHMPHTTKQAKCDELPTWPKNLQIKMSLQIQPWCIDIHPINNSVNELLLISRLKSFFTKFTCNTWHALHDTHAATSLLASRHVLCCLHRGMPDV